MILSSFGGSVTKEGKRSASKIGRSAKEQVRLPSSVTSPQSMLFYERFAFMTKRDDTDKKLLGCRATFPSGEGFFSMKRLAWNRPADLFAREEAQTTFIQKEK